MLTVDGNWVDDLSFNSVLSIDAVTFNDNG